MKSAVAASLVALSLSFVTSAHGADVSKLDQRIDASRLVLHELMQTSDKGIPLDIAAKAHCVVIVPGFKKGAFLVGAQYGQGVATCRTAHGWSAPVFVQLIGASFGLQAGGQSTDLVLIGLGQKSADDLLHAKVKLGGDAAVAAGPVGRDSQADTTAMLNADFLTYSRSKGLFAGVDLTGDEIHQNADDTRAYYGRDIPYQKILSGEVPPPASSKPLLATVNHLFREAHAEHASNTH